MMRYFKKLVVALLTIGSCVGYADHLYDRTGGAKPIIAVLPVIDSTEGTKLSWDVSKEITERIRERMVASNRLYLWKEGGNLEIAKELNVANPTKLSKSVCDQLGDTEFVLVTELIEHQEKTFGIADKPSLEEVGADLGVRVRARVIDVRGNAPCIVLQEIISYDDKVNRAYLSCDYEKACFGTEAFERTPIGMAHSKITRELVARVEGYIGARRG